MQAQAQNSRTACVMVVDDDPQIRAIIRMALKDIIEVIEVGAGELALETYRKIRPSVVLLDLHLPCAEGLQVLQDIMSFDAQAYVYMLSADSLQDNVQSTFISGARGFIAKPFEKKKVIEAVMACPGLRFRRPA